MKTFPLSFLLGMIIPLAIHAQEKNPPPSAASPAKPGETTPPVAVAKPVPEPEASPDPEEPGTVPSVPDSGEPAPKPAPEKEPVTVEPTLETPGISEPVEPPNMRVTLVDGTRRVAVPLQKPGQTPASGKSALPVVTSPYPPKPLAELPAGWKLGIDQMATPMPYQVKLSDGRTLEVEVVPPCLVPDSLGKATVFQIERGGNSAESTLSAARNAHSESRAKVQDLLTKLEATIPPPPAPAPPSP